jgi:hypothetical protein
MNTEQSRKNLDNILSKMGYVHPDKDNRDNTQYMSYSDNKKGESYYSQSFNTYATYDADIPSPDNNANCPTCKKSAAYSCHCALKCKMCSQGHIWHYKNGEIKLGDPHEYEDEIKNNF